MRPGNIFLTTILLALGIGFVLERDVGSRGFNVASECSIPLAVYAGAFDSRFPFSESEFLQALREAIDMWEAPTEQDLFRLGEPTDAGMPVNLVYGKRQERADRLRSGRRDLERREQAIERQERQLQQRRNTLEQEWDDLESQQQRLNRRVEKLNEAMERWNSGEMAQTRRNRRALEKKRDSIESDHENLEQHRRDLQHRSEALNAAFEAFSAEIERYEEQLNAHNSTIASTALNTMGQFEQQGRDRVIEVYQASTADELRLVLAHELGHALGIGHLDHTEAVMNPVTSSENLSRDTISGRDRSALRETCSGGT